MNQNNSIKKDNYLNGVLIKRFFVLCMIFSLIFNQVIMIPEVKANTGSSVSFQIDYVNETVTILPGPGASTKFYISVDMGKNWELLDSNVVDISTILAKKPVILIVKGNRDTNPVSIPLKGEDSSLKVTYSIASGVGKITYTSTLPVEYRKGANGPWKSASNLMTTGIYELRGATLFFRTAAVAAEARAGKPVTVKIPKRPAAPSVKVDGGKFMITGIKGGQTQYRVGDSVEWLTVPNVTTIKSLNISALLAPTATGTNQPIPAGTIEFRSMGSDKKLHSAVKIIGIAPQASAPETIAVSGTSITVTDTDLKRNYEYTVVKNGATLNLNTAKWTSFTAKNSVVVKGAIVGDKILVRLKSTTDSTTKQVILASTYKEFPVTTVTTGR